MRRMTTLILLALALIAAACSSDDLIEQASDELAEGAEADSAGASVREAFVDWALNVPRVSVGGQSGARPYVLRASGFPAGWGVKVIIHRHGEPVPGAPGSIDGFADEFGSVAFGYKPLLNELKAGDRLLVSTRPAQERSYTAPDIPVYSFIYDGASSPSLDWRYRADIGRFIPTVRNLLRIPGWEGETVRLRVRRTDTVRNATLINGTATDVGGNWRFSQSELQAGDTVQLILSPAGGTDQVIEEFTFLGPNIDPNHVDLDLDGQSRAQGDCNDNDARVLSGDHELLTDGLDNDCDGIIDNVSVEIGGPSPLDVVRIPDGLVGMNGPAAEASLEGFTVTVVYVPVPDAERGIVTRVDPPSGQLVSMGQTPVTLYVGELPTIEGGSLRFFACSDDVLICMQLYDNDEQAGSSVELAFSHPNVNGGAAAWDLSGASAAKSMDDRTSSIALLNFSDEAVGLWFCGEYTASNTIGSQRCYYNLLEPGGRFVSQATLRSLNMDNTISSLVWQYQGFPVVPYSGVNPPPYVSATDLDAIDFLSLQSVEGSIELPDGEVPSLALPAQAIPSNALPASALPASALPASAIPSNAIPSNAIPSNAIPSN